MPCPVGVQPYGHSHLPRVRPCPASLKLGLCVCIKPAKSVSRICESASSRQSSSKLPCHRRACFRQAALLCHSHQSPEPPALALFRDRKERPLGTSAHPRSDTSGHLGGIESALTGAYGFFLVAAASTTVHCEIHAVSANHLNDFRPSGRSRAHSTSVHRPTATCRLPRGSALPLPLRLRNSIVQGRSHTTTAHLSDVFASGCTRCAFIAFFLLKACGHRLSDRRFWCDLVCLAPTYVPPPRRQAALCHPEPQNTESRYLSLLF